MLLRVFAQLILHVRYAFVISFFFFSVLSFCERSDSVSDSDNGKQWTANRWQCPLHWVAACNEDLADRQDERCEKSDYELENRNLSSLKKIPLTRTNRAQTAHGPLNENWISTSGKNECVYSDEMFVRSFIRSFTRSLITDSFDHEYSVLELNIG